MSKPIWSGQNLFPRTSWPREPVSEWQELTCRIVLGCGHRAQGAFPEQQVGHGKCFWLWHRRRVHSFEPEHNRRGPQHCAHGVKEPIWIQFGMGMAESDQRRQVVSRHENMRWEFGGEKCNKVSNTSHKRSCHC